MPLRPSPSADQLVREHELLWSHRCSSKVVFNQVYCVHPGPTPPWSELVWVRLYQYWIEHDELRITPPPRVVALAAGERRSTVSLRRSHRGHTFIGGVPTATLSAVPSWYQPVSPLVAAAKDIVERKWK